MNSRSFRNVVISYFVLCFLSFGAFGTRYLVIDSDVSAQKTNPTLPGDKSSQDLEIPFTEGEYEVGPDFLFESKADVVQGRIIDIKTTYEDYSAYTTYTIETQRVIRPYLLDKETLGLYMANNSAPPEAIGQTFKISRPGGKVMVHGRRVTYTVPAMEKFVKDQSYIFFLGWSSNSKTHTLVGSNSGAFLVQDSGQIVPLATKGEILKAYDEILGERRDVESLIQGLKKLPHASPRMTRNLLRQKFIDSNSLIVL